MEKQLGYYSIIQFCPELSQLEALNVGVVLFCPEKKFLTAKTTLGLERIKKTFRINQKELKIVKLMLSQFSGRFENEKDVIRSREEFASFASDRANHFLMTPPRAVWIDEPVAKLDALFSEMVYAEPPKTSKNKLNKELSEIFKNANLGNKIKENVTVSVNAFDFQENFPFGYQNGRFNLIKTEDLESGTDKDIRMKSSLLAVEGESLYKSRDANYGELQLVTVAKLPSSGDKSKRYIDNLMKQNNVELVSWDEINQFIDKIRQNAKPVSPSQPITQTTKSQADQVTEFGDSD